VTLVGTSAPGELDASSHLSTTSGRLRQRSNRYAIVIPAASVVILFAVSWLVPIAADEKPNALVAGSLLKLSWAHPFGTDELGRDLFARVLGGMRISSEIALITVIVAGVTGTAIGLYSGYHAGWRDSLMMRIVDFFLGFPVLVFALLLAAIIGPSVFTPAVATTVISVPLFARMVRASSLAERNKEYVLASRALGASGLRIMFRTLLPSVMGVVLVQGAIVGALSIQVEAALSFLGVGVPPPAPSLGSLLSDALAYIYNAPWYAVFPGLALALMVGSFMFLANGLEAHYSVRPGTAQLRQVGIAVD
jgi:peptide/nickel transport system permease protein